MLDPRSVAERRDEIVESCRVRGVRADVDAVAALHEAVSARQTELNEANRRRNEHQKAGKQKLDEAERTAHTSEGRALKEAVSRIEAQLQEQRGQFDEAPRRPSQFRAPRGSGRWRGGLPRDSPRR